MNVDRALRKLQQLAMTSVREDSKYAPAAVRAIGGLGALRFEAAFSREARDIIGKTLLAVSLAVKPARGRRKSLRVFTKKRHVQPETFSVKQLVRALGRSRTMFDLRQALAYTKDARRIMPSRSTILRRVAKNSDRSDVSEQIAVKPWLRRGTRRRSTEDGMVSKASSE